MRNLFIIIFLSTLLFSCHCIEKNRGAENVKSDDITTYYLIRHAEKERNDPLNKDPELTEKGKERAKHWDSFFQKVKLDEIYSTAYLRTKQTVENIAESKNIAIQNYSPKALYTDDFKKKTVGKTVLIVGHSNTTPKFVNSIIGEAKYSDMEDSDNSSLYVVTLLGNKKEVQVLTVD